MAAVAYRRPLPITEPAALEDVTLPTPTPGPHDLLVDVRAVSVNPVDTKQRRGTDPNGEPKVLGYDAAGVVVGVGSEVSMFEVGADVYYAGSIARQGTNAEYHVVDERIVGPKPVSLSFSEAAALPLTTITAWETLFDRLRLGTDDTGTMLVPSAAGGVGSMILQLGRVLTGLEFVGTASREESRAWAAELGAHHVIGHDDLPSSIDRITGSGLDYIFSPRTAGMIPTYAEILRPGGAIVAVDEPEGLDILPLKAKSITFHWEMMFTRPLFQTNDMINQHHLLARVATLVDEGKLKSTMTTELSGLDAGSVRRAHEMIEDGHMVGKVVIGRA
ncbi:zinc-binding alcohol dehydrogenase family protein [Pseudonocardia sp. C8]|nr:zinc-binding alcohol dehydrogenase family protein [Pseudonocardia sp. C8]